MSSPLPPDNVIEVPDDYELTSQDLADIATYCSETGDAFDNILDWAQLMTAKGQNSRRMLKLLLDILKMLGD